MSERGQLGEILAGRYLVRRGWKIVARNWSGAGGELDIVALRAGVLAFVEVKSRAEASELDDPVRYGQRGRMIDAARLFVARHPTFAGTSARFDVVAIDMSRRWRRVDHIADAFEMDASVDTPPSPNSRNSGYATDRNDRR
jgi:putative endonuclease